MTEIQQSTPFDEFWAAYPRKVGKGVARQKFAKALKLTDMETIMAALERYKDKLNRDGTEERYILHPSTWLHQERWEDQYEQKQEGCELDTKTILYWQEKYRRDPRLVPRDMQRICGLGEYAR